MLSAERRQIISQRLQASGRVVASELKAEFSVSEETIRRDLERLEREGIAQRTYGGAVLSRVEKAPPPYAVRKTTNVEGKLTIARLTAAMLQDGDTVMVDESSTAAYTVNSMGYLNEITLITNSLEVLQTAAERKSWNVISTGGRLKSDVMALVGPHALETIASYHVHYALLSCRGVNTRLGYADSSDEIIQVKRAMAAAAGCTVLLADHRKFDRPGFAALGPIKMAGRLVTDREPAPEWKTRFEEQGVILCYE